MAEYDVAIIGAGPGGYVAAIRAAQLGLKAAIIEKAAVGGLCLNWGCIPSKALLHAADLINLFRRGPEFGISSGELALDLGVSVDRSRDVVARVVSNVETLLRQNGVTLIHGTAKLTGPDSITVSPANQTVEATNIIVATGGRPNIPASIKVDGDRVITSREALALRQRPESIVIIGGGAIGSELGYLYRSYGTRVTIVEIEDHLLPGEDQDVSRALERSFRSQGIEVLTSARVEAVQVEQESATVVISEKGVEQSLTAERVLVAAGYGPNSEGLGLAEAGVKLERGWVSVDEYSRTNVPNIWAIGDVTGRMLLAHVASHQGITAVESIAGISPPALDYSRMPRAVYCQPQVASLGLTEAQARADGFEVATGRFPFAANGKSLAAGETEGFVKLVVDAGSGSVLGYHMIGVGVVELLGEATLGAQLETTTAELGYAVHAHPTLAEAVKEAALALQGGSIHYYSGRLR
jgi:dihydrolipoamide dehydrogenase